MLTKELLIQEIESMTEIELKQILTIVKKIKTESNYPNKTAKPPSRLGSGKSILRHAGKWVGDDLQECLDIVYSSRGDAEF